MGICTFTRGVWMDWKCGGGRFRSEPGKLQGKGKLLKRTRMLGGEASGENQEMEGDKLSIQHWWAKNTKQKKNKKGHSTSKRLQFYASPIKIQLFLNFCQKKCGWAKTYSPHFKVEREHVSLCPPVHTPLCTCSHNDILLMILNTIDLFHWTLMFSTVW